MVLGIKPQSSACLWGPCSSPHPMSPVPSLHSIHSTPGLSAHAFSSCRVFAPTAPSAWNLQCIHFCIPLQLILQAPDSMSPPPGNFPSPSPSMEASLREISESVGKIKSLKSERWVLEILSKLLIICGSPNFNISSPGSLPGPCPFR